MWTRQSSILFFTGTAMSFTGDFEYSAKQTLSVYGHYVAKEFQSAEHEVVNATRVAEVLAKGAWDYTKEHPADVAKSIAIAAGVGLVSGALTPLLPAVAVVGMTAGLGAVGTAALGIKTFDAAKNAMPDLEIVWNADMHSKADVAKAEKSVEQKTGEAATNLALLPLTFIVGNAAGTVGTKALVAAATATENTLGAVTIIDSLNESGSSGIVSTDKSAAIVNGEDSWAKMMNNPVFNFFSSPYVAKADVRTVVNGLARTTSSNLDMPRKSA